MPTSSGRKYKAVYLFVLDAVVVGRECGIREGTAEMGENCRKLAEWFVMAVWELENGAKTKGKTSTST